MSLQQPATEIPTGGKAQLMMAQLFSMAGYDPQVTAAGDQMTSEVANLQTSKSSALAGDLGDTGWNDSLLNEGL